MLIKRIALAFSVKYFLFSWIISLSEKKWYRTAVLLAIEYSLTKSVFAGLLYKDVYFSYSDLRLTLFLFIFYRFVLGVIISKI